MSQACLYAPRLGITYCACRVPVGLCERPTLLPLNRYPTDYLLWLVGKEPVVIGYAQLVPHSNNDASVWSVEICPSMRGRGYGRILMSLVVEEARRLHMNNLWLRVDRDNVVARKLYDQLGFQQKDDESVRYVLPL